MSAWNHLNICCPGDSRKHCRKQDRTFDQEKQHILFKLPGNPITYTFIKSPSSPIFKSLGTLKIGDMFQMSTLKFVYESLNKMNSMNTLSTLQIIIILLLRRTTWNKIYKLYWMYTME